MKLLSLLKRERQEQPVEEAVIITKPIRLKEGMTPPTVFKGGFYVFPYDASTLRHYERHNPEMIAVVNSLLDLVFGTNLHFVGPGADEAEAYFDYEKLMKIVKELFIMGNAFIYVEPDGVEILPAEYIYFKYTGDGWEPYFFTGGEVVKLDETKLIHLKLTPMTIYPFGVPPAVALIPLIDIKDKLYQAIASTTTLVKSPIFKVVTSKPLLAQIKQLFQKWRDEGGVNFVAVADGVYDIEPVNPPNLQIEKFAEMVDKEIFREALHPDIQFFQHASKMSAEVMFMIVSMRAKRILYLLEEGVAKALKMLGIEAKLTHDFLPDERPTVDLMSLAQFVDMGVIAPHEARQILVKAGVLDPKPYNGQASKNKPAEGGENARGKEVHKEVFKGELPKEGMEESAERSSGE